MGFWLMLGLLVTGAACLTVALRRPATRLRPLLVTIGVIALVLGGTLATPTGADWLQVATRPVTMCR